MGFMFDKKLMEKDLKAVSSLISSLLFSISIFILKFKAIEIFDGKKKTWNDVLSRANKRNQRFAPAPHQRTRAQRVRTKLY